MYPYEAPAFRPAYRFPLGQAPAAPAAAPPSAPPARRETNVGDIVMLAGGAVAGAMGGYGLYKGLAGPKPMRARAAKPLWLIGNAVVAALGITVLVQKAGRIF